MIRPSRLAALLLAALAWQAHAQSSVTVYGRFDIGLKRTNNGLSSLDNGGTPDAWEVVQAQSSRLGFMGTEDLGDGWRAGFRLEHRFNPDTGVQTRPVFWRGRSWVNLQHRSLGELRLGRDKPHLLDLSTDADPFEGDYVAGLGGGFTEIGYSIPSSVAGNPSDSRADDMVRWSSPRWSGFQLGLAVSAADGVRTQRTEGVTLNYRQGPIKLTVATDRQSSSNKVTLVNGIYDFKILKLTGGYVFGSVPEGSRFQDRTAYMLGVIVPAGLGEFLAVYGHQDREDIAATATTDEGQSRTKFGLGYRYNMSKRTQLYTTYGNQREVRRAAGATPGSFVDAPRSRRAGYDFGITHSF
jgi:predicted porin